MATGVKRLKGKEADFHNDAKQRKEVVTVNLKRERDFLNADVKPRKKKVQALPDVVETKKDRKIRKVDRKVCKLKNQKEQKVGQIKTEKA